jgi:hypothetical protein
VSNALGIAAVTAVLKDILNNRAIDASVGNVTVTTKPPDKLKTDAHEETQLNLFLYQVTPNQGWRNVGQPSVASDGANRLTNPPLALDLHYLLSAYSDEEFKAEVLLGYGMQALHETPVLTREMVRNHFTADPTGLTGGGLPPPLDKLAAGELADQVELVKITPQALSTEEISKLWTAFGASYRPTAGYQATVVLIEGRRPTKSALPVRNRRLYALTIREPRIDAVESNAGPDAFVVPASKLVVRGRRLVGEVTEVLVSGQVATIDSMTPEEIVADQPAGLRAGVQAVQVAHRVLMGDPPPGTPHRGFESNVAAFVLHPTFGGLTSLTPVPAGATPYTGTATVTVTPQVGRAQRVVLLLNSRVTSPAQSYAFVADPRASDAAPIKVLLQDVVRGDYFVRVQVDGAESPVNLDWATSTTKTTI